MSAAPRSTGVGARLRTDLKKAKVSARRLGALLAERAGKPEEAENYRKYVERWKKYVGDEGMEPPNAEAVAAVLGTDPARYASKNKFLSPEELTERQVARMKAKIRELERRPPREES